jgi:hypothetical protein
MFKARRLGQNKRSCLCDDSKRRQKEANNQAAGALRQSSGLLRLKLQCDPVHAVTQAGGWRAVLEHVSAHSKRRDKHTHPHTRSTRQRWGTLDDS